MHPLVRFDSDATIAVDVLLEIHAETIELPGAKISTKEPKFENEEDKKHWGYGEEALFKMLNDIANGKLKK